LVPRPAAVKTPRVWALVRLVRVMRDEAPAVRVQAAC
jgi:hypothetical protein